MSVANDKARYLTATWMKKPGQDAVITWDSPEGAHVIKMELEERGIKHEPASNNLLLVTTDGGDGIVEVAGKDNLGVLAKRGLAFQGSSSYLRSDGAGRVAR